MHFIRLQISGKKFGYTSQYPYIFGHYSLKRLSSINIAKEKLLSLLFSLFCTSIIPVIHLPRPGEYPLSAEKVHRYKYGLLVYYSSLFPFESNQITE